MNNLIVYLNNERVGNLKQDDSGLLQFSYDQAWLEKPDAMPLSRSLPLQSEVFSGKTARPVNRRAIMTNFKQKGIENYPPQRFALFLIIFDSFDQNRSSAYTKWVKIGCR